MSRRAGYLHSLLTRQEVILLPLATSTGDFHSAVASLAPALTADGGEEALARSSDEGAALVCLDGLDEVAPAPRGRLLAWLGSWTSSTGAPGAEEECFVLKAWGHRGSGVSARR
jgi:hypothetical protein